MVMLSRNVVHLDIGALVGEGVVGCGQFLQPYAGSLIGRTHIGVAGGDNEDAGLVHGLTPLQITQREDRGTAGSLV
jgi:hypothetical protein